MAGLARHVDPEDIIANMHEGPKQQKEFVRHAQSHLTPFSTKYNSQTEIPKYHLSKDGAPADSVYEMLRNELDLDGRPNLNLASFVGTYMEPYGEKLVIENLSKNLSDADEYPAMMNIHARCVNIIANLWGAQKGEKPIGTATTGSSEAVQLGGLAMKRRWKEARDSQGKDTSKPNIIMGSNAQVALEKFARYFDVEPRMINVSEKSRYRIDPSKLKENLDENTIGVFVILGSTYTGHYEPVEEISRVLDDYEKETGIYIPIHVDAASGGFVAPFALAKSGDTKWNFELPRVKSINTSGVGWIIFRDEGYLPKHLIFELHYLGGTEESFTLNFSRPGAQVIGQYFNLVHLGFKGYQEIIENCLSNARLLSHSLEATGWYRCLSDIHRQKNKFQLKGDIFKTSNKSSDYNAGLPVVAFALTDDFKEQYPHVKQASVSNLLRARQWIIPNYPLPPDENSTEILRVVVRESMPMDLLDRLINDICSVTEYLMSTDREIDLAAWQPFVASPEKRFARAGVEAQHKDKAKRPMEHGVHRAVC